MGMYCFEFCEVDVDCFNMFECLFGGICVKGVIGEKGDICGEGVEICVEGLFCFYEVEDIF